MNRNAIRLAVAALLPLATSSVWALTPALTQAIPAGNVIYVSGSTAIDPALQAFFELSPASDTRAPCVSGTMDLFKSAGGYIISCTASPAFTGGVAGQNIAVAKQTQGGSAVGISNVTRGTAAAGFTNITTISSSIGTTTPNGATGPFMAFNTYSVTSAEVAKSPNAGVSDVDPNTFVGIGGVLSSDLTGLTAVQGLQQPFGIIVNLDLYHALQTAEGLTANDAYANVPSLTGPQVRAILSGQILSGTDLWVADKANHTIQRQVGDGSLPHICRRGDTSGSQLATNIYFYNSGCAKGAGIGSVQAPDNGLTVTSGAVWSPTGDIDDFVFAGSGTGDVKACVSSAKSSSDSSNYRIGFVSTDNKPANTPTDTWRFVAINDQPGTVYSILQGRYDYLTEDTLNSTTASLALNGGGNHTAIWSYVTGNVGNRVSIAGYNAKFQNAWDIAGTATPAGIGDSGVLTLGKPNGDPDALTVPMSGAGVVRLLTAGNGPASTVARTFPGSPVNNCNNIFQVNPSN